MVIFVVFILILIHFNFSLPFILACKSFFSNIILYLFIYPTLPSNEIANSF